MVLLKIAYKPYKNYNSLNMLIDGLSTPMKSMKIGIHEMNNNDSTLLADYPIILALFQLKAYSNYHKNVYQR